MDHIAETCTELALLARANLCEELARMLTKEAVGYREAASRIACNLPKEEDI